MDIEQRIAASHRRVIDAGDRYAEALARRTGQDVEDVKAEVQGKIERIMRKFT
jgi:hypothetical protein